MVWSGFFSIFHFFVSFASFPGTSMAKTTPKTTQKISASGLSRSASPSLLSRRPHAVFLTLLAILLAVFFHEALFSGKVFHVPDNIASIVYEQWYLEKAKTDGINAFWNPYVFSGMPTWGSSTPGHGLYLHTFLDPFKPNVIMQIYGWVQAVVNILPVPKIFWDIVNYFLLGLFTYFFALRRKFEPMTAFLTAVSVVFTLYSLNWIMAGHNTKITVLAWLPALLLLVDRLVEKKSPLTIAFLIAALHFTFNSGHVQMIFYALFAVGLYLLFKWYEGARPASVALVALIVLGSAVFAFLMLSGPYLATWEYKDFSIRGAGSGGSGVAGTAPATGGLDYQYATNWSFSPVEIFTFFVPSFVGWGTPTYWGTMPFTESPIYLGVVGCFLALLALILKPRDKFVHFWVALGLLTLLISMGRNFSLLYDLFFYHVPFFNNFRIPSMILFLQGLTIGMLAGVGLGAVMERIAPAGKNRGGTDGRVLKALWFPVGGALILFLILLVNGSGMKSSIAEDLQKHQPQSWNLVQQVEQAAQNGMLDRVPPEYQKATVDGIYGMAVNDALVALVFMILAALLLTAFVKGSVSRTLVQAGLVILLVADLWIVDFKPMKMDSRVVQEQNLQRTEVVDFLQKSQATDPQFRILPVSSHGGDNWYVGFGIPSVAGYHPAKLKLYDDIRNSVFNEFQFGAPQQIDMANWRLLSMMNTKYVVVPASFTLQAPWLRLVFQGAQEHVYENGSVLPRAFFVRSAQVLPSEKDLFATLGLPSYRPDLYAYMLDGKAPTATLDSAQLARTRVKYLGGTMNESRYEVETPAPAILKFSEVYYPSGWTATIDETETPIHRTDYAFRAVVVPAGRHVVTMRFEPTSYRAGLMITVVTNYLLLAIFLVYLGLALRKRFATRTPTPPSAS